MKLGWVLAHNGIGFCRLDDVFTSVISLITYQLHAVAGLPHEISPYHSQISSVLTTVAARFYRKEFVVWYDTFRLHSWMKRSSSFICVFTTFF